MEQHNAELPPPAQFQDSQISCSSGGLPTSEPMVLSSSPISARESGEPTSQSAVPESSFSQLGGIESQTDLLAAWKRTRDEFDNVDDRESDEKEDTRALQDSQASTLTENAFEIRAASYRAVLENARGNPEFQHIGLISTTENHSTMDQELGEG